MIRGETLQHQRTFKTATGRRVRVGALVACLAFGAMSGPSFAAKGSGGKPGGSTSSSSLRVVMVDDANGDGNPDWGDVITFDISTTDTTQPNVSLKCSQAGTVVYGAVAGFYPGYPWPWTQQMSLSSTAWSGGSADCTAVLQKYSGAKVINLTSISFAVGA
jgi:hypothetical protein